MELILFSKLIFDNSCMYMKRKIFKIFVEQEIGYRKVSY